MNGPLAPEYQDIRLNIIPPFTKRMQQSIATLATSSFGETDHLTKCYNFPEFEKLKIQKIIL